LGRIGLALAAALLQCGDGAVVLTSRGRFPPREQWEALLAADSTAATAAGQKLRLVGTHLGPHFHARGEGGCGFYRARAAFVTILTGEQVDGRTLIQ
jgi:hypothetical protein